MEESNYRSLRSLDKDQKYTRKLSKMTSYCIVHDVLEVPDPYYGGAEGFELTYDILEDACNGLFEKLKR